MQYKNRKRRKIGQRKYWVKPGRTSLWWENLMNGLLTEEEWKNKLRKSRNDFFYLVDLLKPDIDTTNPVFRDIFAPSPLIFMFWVWHILSPS